MSISPNPTAGSPRSQASNARWASSSPPVTSIVARAGQLSPGAALHSGSAVSAALNLTTGLRTFHASSRARESPGASWPSSSRGATLGSALQMTVRAKMRLQLGLLRGGGD
jgi:hypothetical protein